MNTADFRTIPIALAPARRMRILIAEDNTVVRVATRQRDIVEPLNRAGTRTSEGGKG